MRLSLKTIGKLCILERERKRGKLYVLILFQSDLLPLYFQNNNLNRIPDDWDLWLVCEIKLKIIEQKGKKKEFQMTTLKSL